MLATVSRLRRLLRNADLATKLVKVIGVLTFYTAEGRSPLRSESLPPVKLRRSVEDFVSSLSSNNSRYIHLRTPHERGLVPAFKIDPKANKVCQTTPVFDN